MLRLARFWIRSEEGFMASRKRDADHISKIGSKSSVKTMPGFCAVCGFRYEAHTRSERDNCLKKVTNHE